MTELAVEFLILGLTGPLGAGCSTLAKQVERVTPGKWIHRRKLYETTLQKLETISQQMKMAENRGDDTELEQLHSQLIEHLETRRYLDVLRRVKDPKFRYISMSSLILKLAVENITSPGFETWGSQHEKLSKLLLNFKERWLETIELYNTNFRERNQEEETTTSNVQTSDKKRIDTMLSELDELRAKFSKAEIEELFTSGEQKLVLQSFGNNLRRSGNPFATDSGRAPTHLDIIAREANYLMKYYRHHSPTLQANCFVVDAFRNPAEVEFFRKRFNKFFLISVYAERETRSKRMRKQFEEILPAESSFSSVFDILDKTDWGSDVELSESHLQNVSRCSYLADIAINNNQDTDQFNDALFMKFLRYYALIVSPGCVQPTKEEMYMNLAYSLSLRSSCLSRQVGAVITDSDGYVLGLGWNDVGHGQVSCALLQKEDFLSRLDRLFKLDVFKGIFEPNDLDDLTQNQSLCFKDMLSSRLLRDKIEKANLTKEQKQEALRVLRIKRLEYCRALHAEENAILQIAAKGGVGVHGGVIYTTTFPCELCAKKIYQSGIRKVIYTEPYPNSYSEQAFLKAGIRQIETKQFEGVKSFSYFKLYKPTVNAKEAQRLDNLRSIK